MEYEAETRSGDPGRLAMLFMVPAVSSAQSAIVGLLTDLLRRRASRRVGRSVQPRDDRRVENRRHRQPGPLSLRGDEAGPLQVRPSRSPALAPWCAKAWDLPSNFTVTLTVNAEMKVGSLEETINVSGTASQVDVQQATKNHRYRARRHRLAADFAQRDGPRGYCSRRAAEHTRHGRYTNDRAGGPPALEGSVAWTATTRRRHVDSELRGGRR